MEVICERDPSQGPLGQLVSSLNKWDPQRLEEPDYVHRLKTHKEVNAVLETGTPSFEWTSLVLYNSFYVIRTVSVSLQLCYFCFSTELRLSPLVLQRDR